ncbi:MAG: hypothetical protein OEY18_06015 [Candidatus Aminicenantes bacterium]|nr:hypothetical protein [Candidatus Aminicenantes bacterium]MDH5384246.1 hypothetical protein [Candidatus Aminicenantes bacterium]MDH5742994.1 hypothetical protein [Candidatus Aminicenantes bacterium]
MKKISSYLVAVLIVLSLPRSSFPQIQEEPSFRIKPGIHFEYFSRKITWDDKKHTSDLKSTMIALNTELEMDWGLSLNGIIGFAMTSFDGLVFRQLPFSVELEVGNIEGYILGAELKKSLFSLNNFEIGVFGQIVHNIGKKKDWDTTVLNVQGTITGKPTWTRASVGPVFQYTGLERFYPYLRVCYNKLWGTFQMDQVIQTLEGTEEKKINGTNMFEGTLGSIFELGKGFSFRGEIHLLPYSYKDEEGKNRNGIDMGFLAVAAFSF